VQIQRNIEPGLPAIEGDHDRLVQVFINLISNSIKFCYPEIGTIRIKVRLEYPVIRVQIIDNGSGIDPLFHELIFDKFYQTTDQSIRKPKGSGLGLAITKKILELHGGTIKVESTPGQGATFTFEIPIVQTKTN
jgi:signal transduction histidine kinase